MDNIPYLRGQIVCRDLWIVMKKSLIERNEDIFGDFFFLKKKKEQWILIKERL